MNWMRFYVDVLDDPKVAQMDDPTYRIFTYLLLVAKEENLNGKIEKNDEEIAWRLRISPKKVKKAIEKITELKIICRNGSGYKFHNWAKRQYKSDDVNERVKRFRNKNETLHETGQIRLDTEQNRTEQITSCPHSKIVELYNDILGSKLPTVRHRYWENSAGAKNLSARWKQDPKHQTMEYWKGLFEYIRDKCPFLLGENDKKWNCDLRWIVNKENFIKVVEAKYERR